MIAIWIGLVVTAYAFIGTALGTISYFRSIDAAESIGPGWDIAFGILWPLGLAVLIIVEIVSLPYLVLEKFHKWLLRLLKVRAAK